MARRLFLERRTYRQNRLQDAARLLPILGLILIFGPIFIRGEEFMRADGGMPAHGDASELAAPTLAGELVYYFAIWLGLIALTALVSRALIGTGPAATDTETAADPPAPPAPPAARAPATGPDA